MTVKSADELEGLRAAGKVVAETLVRMAEHAAPGVTTAELDAVADEVFAAAGARSGPRLDYNFPGTTCISVNDEAVHGIPGPRRLRAGDLVKLDVTVELDGLYADACVTVPIGQTSSQGLKLIDAANRALAGAMTAACAGVPLNDVGGTVERIVKDSGFSVCRDLMGHGIGRKIHEPPHVFNHFVPGNTQRLHEGLVITIEPIISAGNGHIRPLRDGWTVCTRDAALSAHVEHTVVITGGEPVVITAS